MSFTRSTAKSTHTTVENTVVGFAIITERRSEIREPGGSTKIVVSAVMVSAGDESRSISKIYLPSVLMYERMFSILFLHLDKYTKVKVIIEVVVHTGVNIYKGIS